MNPHKNALQKHYFSKNDTTLASDYPLRFRNKILDKNTKTNLYN